jgi:FKBP-type peptidyl-prolyl cis-trans isomerase SlyD
MEIVKKKDFVEIKFTGYANGVVFDSNVEEDLKKVDSEAKPKETIVVVGEGMLVPGFDNALEGKEIGKDYEIKLSPKEGFGDRKKVLMKTIPLKVFTEQKINPYPGMVLSMDNALARVITVSGARVMTDFNNPLSGKDLVYKFKVVRVVNDEKEKAKTVFEFMFKFVPEFEVKEKVIVKGPKILENFVNAFKEKFKELCGKELGFELVEQKKEEKTDSDKKQ